MPFNIAIDGPAGAGKSTVAKQLAKNLGYIYVDTGAMYRAMALYFLRKGINKDDAGAIEAACEGVEISLEYKDGVQQIILNGENVTSLIRTEEVGNMAGSRVRAIRRYKELQEKNVDCSLEEIEKDIIERDYRDMHREIAPLAQAEDAVLLDSSEMTLEEVLCEMESLVEDAGSKGCCGC